MALDLFFCSLALVAQRTEQIVTRQGLFDWIGSDYAIFGATARCRHRTWLVICYDVDAITEEAPPSGPTTARCLAPPRLDRARIRPSSFCLLSSLTDVRLGGFAAWTLANLLAVLVIMRGMLPGADRRGQSIYLATFAFAPLWYGLLMGQLAILMTFGLFKSYRAFQGRREFQAGLWLGLLLLKPQFALRAGNRPGGQAPLGSRGRTLPLRRAVSPLDRRSSRR